MSVQPLHAQPATPAVVTLDRAEAVRADWHATTPPASGWVPVKLLDYWDTRWPKHDGVVWYRLHWNQASADAPTGVLLEYVCLADAIYVNGSLIHRDPQLVEPLSRSWVAPQYLLIDRPVLRAGENTLLVRVSGLSSYQPGFGLVKIGNPETVFKLYLQGKRWRYDVRQFDFAISAVLGVLFGMFWLLRRKDTVYAWYALNTLLGAGYSWNYVASSTWPMAGTDAWEALNTVLFVTSINSFVIFLLRFCAQRWPRTEAALLLFSGSVIVFAWIDPQLAGPWRNLWIVPITLVYYIAIGIFLWHAARSRRIDVRVLGASQLLPVLVSFHDIAVYMQWIADTTYRSALTSPLSLFGMSFAVAWRFSEAMRRVEGFNVELKHEVDIATAQLGATLAREHALALDNTRIGERLNLVRDLHDGFGGSLLGAIATLENPLHPPEPGRMVSTLKELRDDLRLVIDTTTHEQDADLAELLAPLRYRWSQRLDVARIDSRWQLDGLDGLHLGPARSLDLMRLLQEALTNVLKHSHATHVDIIVRRDDARLSIKVRDDGSGFDSGATSGSGAGLASLHIRAARLGGKIMLVAAPGKGVALSFDTTL